MEDLGFSPGCVPRSTVESPWKGSGGSSAVLVEKDGVVPRTEALGGGIGCSSARPDALMMSTASPPGSPVHRELWADERNGMFLSNGDTG